MIIQEIPLTAGQPAVQHRPGWRHLADQHHMARIHWIMDLQNDRGEPVSAFLSSLALILLAQYACMGLVLSWWWSAMTTHRIIPEN